MQDISSADAVAEGVRSRLPDNGIAISEFMDLWNGINGKRPKPMKLTSALLRQAAYAAWKQQQMQAKLTEAFEQRYGTTYSAVDADEIIDLLDYGGGAMLTLADCDRIMTNCGFPPKVRRNLRSAR